MGRPNAGKSTLFNTFLDQRLSIVTPRPQTTRGRVLGILTRPSSQVIFFDTPGLLEPSYLLHERMEQQIQRCAREADVVLLMLDATRIDDRRELISKFRDHCPTPLLGVLNKIDTVPDTQIADMLEAEKTHYHLDDLRPLSALDGTHVDDLLSRLEQAVPIGPPLYPEDMVAEQPERFFVAELIRETAFYLLTEELPYAIEVFIDEFRTASEPSLKTYIGATIFVERDSQKGIVIGRGGRRLREIGSQSRVKIEELIDGPVYLALRVKVRLDWRKRDRDLREFGYS